jgi:hypothetical protein
MTKVMTKFTGLEIDTNSPTITAVASTPNTGSVGLGQKVSIELDPSDDVTVIGAPSLKLSDAGIALYDAAASSSNKLVFDYFVKAGETSSDLKISSVTLPSGASVKDSAGNGVNFGGALADIGLKVDSVAPTVTKVSAAPATNSLNDGDTVAIKFSMSEAVAVTGTPVLRLDDGGKAIYDAGASTPTTLVFDYTVGLGENSKSLQVTHVDLFNSTIQDLAGNDAALSKLTANLGLQVDTKSPTVTKANALPGTGVEGVGKQVAFTLTMSEAVSVTGGNPTLLLDNGGIATYDAKHSTATSLAFNYTVDASDTSSAALTITKLDLQGASIADVAGSDAIFGGAYVSFAGLFVDTSQVHWTNKNGGDFATAGNWSPAHVPGLPDDAIIAASGTYVVASNNDATVSGVSTAKTATLDIVSGDFNSIFGTLAGVNAGNILAEDGAKLEFGGIINNSGAISLKGASKDTDLVINSDLTLLGGGKIILTDSAHNALLSGGSELTLTNADNTISGAGSIDQNSGLSIVNQAKGVINATSATNALTIAGSDTLINAGILEATATGGLDIEESSITNINLIQAVGNGVAAAAVHLHGGEITNTGGTLFANGTNAHIDLDGVTLTGGTFKTAGANAAINITSDSSISGVTNTGTLNIKDHVKLTVTGSVLNNTTTGVINIIDVIPTVLVIGSDLTLQGGGKVNLTGVGRSEIDSNGVDAVTLTNADNTIAGVGAIGDDHMTFVNAVKGIVNANDAGGGTLVIDTFSFTNSGLVEATGHGVLEFDSDITNTAAGKLAAAAAGAHINLDDAGVHGGIVSTVFGSFFDSSGGSSTVDTTSAVSNAGRLGAEAGDLTITHGVTNNGTLDANNGHVLSIAGIVTGAGTATVEGNGSILDLGVAASIKTITFGSGNSTLALETSTNAANKFAGTIAGFAVGDDIELGHFTSAATLSVQNFASASGGSLTINEGTNHLTLTFSGDYTVASGHHFAIQDDTHHLGTGHADLVLV